MSLAKEAAQKVAGISVPENIQMPWSHRPVGQRGPIVTWNGPSTPPMKSSSQQRMERAIEYAEANEMPPLAIQAIRDAHAKTQAQEAIHASAQVA